MSSTTRLLVLGVVKLFQPVHGYEVRRELISWRAQEWASVQPGSIYNALKTLTRDGLLEVASTDQVGGRPERTTYRLTSAGQEEFQTLLREEWWAVRPPIDPLMAAVSFLNEVSRAEAIAALEHRAAQVHGMVRAVEFAIENHDGRESPYHVREMMRLMNARVSAELDWARQFVERLRRGEYATADDPAWQPPARSGRTAGPRAARPAGRTRSSPASSRRGAGSDRTLAKTDPLRSDRPAALPRRRDAAASAPQRDRGNGPSRRSDGVAADGVHSHGTGRDDPRRNRPNRRVRTRGPRRSTAR